MNVAQVEKGVSVEDWGTVAGYGGTEGRWCEGRIRGIWGQCPGTVSVLWTVMWQARPEVCWQRVLSSLSCLSPPLLALG